MNGKSVVVRDESMLPGVQKRIALKAIHDTSAAYYLKGGLRDTLSRLRTQGEGISTHIYRLAQYAAKTAPKDPAALFGTLCKHAEEQYKQENGIENLKDEDRGLPVWPVFKSNILGAIRRGFSPLDHKNERALRDARGGGSTRAGGGGKAPAVATLDEFDTILARTVIHRDVRGLVSTALVSLECLRASKRKLAVAILRETNGRLALLVDQRKLQAVQH